MMDVRLSDRALVGGLEGGMCLRPAPLTADCPLFGVVFSAGLGSGGFRAWVAHPPVAYPASASFVSSHVWDGVAEMWEWRRRLQTVSGPTVLGSLYRAAGFLGVKVRVACSALLMSVGAAIVPRQQGWCHFCS